MSTMRDAGRPMLSGIAGRAAVAAVAALVTGLVLSFVAAAWLRSAAPDSGLLSRVAPTQRLAVWTLSAAHGVPVEVTAGAEIESDRLKRIGRLFGREELGTSASLVVRLAPLTILLLAGLVLALTVRDTATEASDPFRAAVVAGPVYGAGLAVLAASAGSWAGLEGRIVRFGVGASVSPLYAFVAGGVWAALFAAIGALARSDVRIKLSPLVRGLWSGSMTAARVAALTAIGGLVVLGVAQASSAGGVDVDPKIGAVGLVLFGVNVVATAVVVSHGPPLAVAFTAGPLAGWSRIGYVPAGQTSLSPARFVFVLVPLLSCLYAGRAMKRHVRRSDAGRAAVTFGLLWGAALAVLALVLRVRVLSSFDIASLEAGGGASINALFAFVSGTVIATVLSYAGMVSGPEFFGPQDATARAGATPPALSAPRPVVCEACGSQVPSGDAFCGACGRPV
jgi:hypothetical protein